MALLLGCATKRLDNDIIYIKALTAQEADSITSYNKGLGLDSYFYYEPKKDSVVLQFSEPSNPQRYKTYVGTFNNDYYLDTLLNLIEKLKRHPDGFLPDTTPIGSVNYCGPALYVEYKDSKGIHNYGFTLVDGNDTLDRFYNFYNNLLNLRWENKVINNKLINAESEIVEALKRVGVYEEIDEPYFPPSCEAGISFTKIYGQWRQVGNDLRDEKMSSYYKLTINKDGTACTNKIENGLQTNYGACGKFMIDKKNEMIEFTVNWGSYTYELAKLTDNCLEFSYISEGKKKSVRYNRL